MGCKRGVEEQKSSNRMPRSPRLLFTIQHFGLFFFFFFLSPVSPGCFSMVSHPLKSTGEKGAHPHIHTSGWKGNRERKKKKPKWEVVVKIRISTIERKLDLLWRNSGTAERHREFPPPLNHSSMYTSRSFSRQLYTPSVSLAYVWAVVCKVNEGNGLIPLLLVEKKNGRTLNIIYKEPTKRRKKIHQ